MFSQFDPDTLIEWLILGAIVYLVAPFDAHAMLGIPRSTSGDAIREFNEWM